MMIIRRESEWLDVWFGQLVSGIEIVMDLVLLWYGMVAGCL